MSLIQTSATSHSTLGAYVSIPFCRAKCSYCNFASGVFGSERMDAYVDRLVDEIHQTRQRVQKWSAILPETIGSIYFGGGTPSLLSIQQMQSIVNALHDVFLYACDVEMTMECAPGQLDGRMLDAMSDLGFNRVSLGVQSFVDREAAAVGRLHTREIVLKEIDRLRRAGIDDINLDLIAGLPHQTPASWQQSLTDAIATGVPHLSVYMLDVDEDSRLGREMLAAGERYGATHVPDEQAIAAMYGQACEQFAAAGVPQYEISNFARAGRESRHNLKYWTRQPYIGFGLDAHSFLQTEDGKAVRTGITDDLAEYLQGEAAISTTRVSHTEAMEEAWFLGLRLSVGVSLTKMERDFGHATVHRFHPILEECQSEGLLERSDDRVSLTARGRLFANEVFTRFLDVLPDEVAETAQLQSVSEEVVA
jgi:oxygen-independent coproporphyrinogen-3 oxidase